MTRRLVIGLALLAAPSVASAQGTSCADFLVSGFITGAQKDPVVASAPNGDFVVIWETEYFEAMLGRTFDASGTPGPEFPISAQFGADPAVAMDTAGNFVVVWGSLGDIRGRRFDASGVPQGTEFPVSTAPDSNSDPRVAADPAGNFVVVWTTNQTVRARRFDAAGVPQGADFQVHPDMTSYQLGASVAFQGTGSFVVVWHGGPVTDRAVRGRRFDASGVPLGGVFQVSDTAAAAAYPRVAAGPGGDFVVVWPRDISGRTMAGRAYDAAGSPRGPAFQVSTAVSASEVGASIAGDPVHGYVAAWRDQATDGFVAQRFDAAGVPTGPNFILGSSLAYSFQSYPEIARGADGRHVAVWEAAAGSGSGVYARLDCPTRLHPVAPCRLADTRVSGSPLPANSSRQFPLSGLCGIPPDARAVVLNVTAVNPTDLGDLRVFPGRTSATLSSVLNFVPGRTRAGHAIVPVGTDGQVAVQCDMPIGSTGHTHVVLDVYGYFEG
jgi:hypothetical protein